MISWFAFLGIIVLAFYIRNEILVFIIVLARIFPYFEVFSDLS